jgi:hypothetical protein
MLFLKLPNGRIRQPISWPIGSIAISLVDMSIPIGVEGKVVNSGRLSHRVLIQDDRTNTGGFLVLEWWDGSTGPNNNSAFDSWVESIDALDGFISESKWEIKWIY